VYNYLIIRVEEPEGDIKSKMFSTRTSLVRRMIHRFCKDNNIVVADNIIRADRTEFPWGGKVPYKEAEELFKKVMNYG